MDLKTFFRKRSRDNKFSFFNYCDTYQAERIEITRNDSIKHNKRKGDFSIEIFLGLE